MTKYIVRQHKDGHTDRLFSCPTWSKEDALREAGSRKKSLPSFTFTVEEEVTTYNLIAEV